MMNLTLLIDDLDEDIFVTNINSTFPIHELVYHINNFTGLNFIRSKELFVLKHNAELLPFDLYYFKQNEENVSYIVSNKTVFESVSSNSNSLFGQDLIETNHFLLKSLKKYKFLLVSGKKEITQNRINSNLIQFFEAKNFTSFNKTEQKIIQNIYYEKQS